MKYYWQQELVRIGLIGGGFLAIGALIGEILIALILSCLLYSAWHFYNIYHLLRWFQKPKKYPLPEPFGIWGEVHYQFYRLQQRYRKRKKKITTLLKNFRRSTAAMPDAAVVLGPHYEIEWFNKAATQLLGLQNPEDKGQYIVNLIRNPVFCNYLAGNLSEVEEHPDTTKFPSPVEPNLMLRISIVPYAKNRHLLLARDITQLHQLEQIRRDFVANISHELRTPLTVINGFIETMQDDEDECAETWERPLMLMAQQATRMQNIVKDLLLLSRLESDSAIINSEMIEIKEMLQNICEEAKLLSGDSNHQISLTVEGEALMYGRMEELRSAFSNLVFNAVRYTPAEGKIHVGWYRDEQGAHFFVQDTGEGIAAEHIPRLTERFYRVDVARSRSKGGTGLGLAIVKHVLNRHEGRLRIDSVEGEGSCFWCDFPNNPLTTPQKSTEFPEACRQLASRAEDSVSLP